jgi:hypothetical protein
MVHGRMVRHYGTKAKIMLPIIKILIQCIDHGLEMFFIAQEIRIAGINKNGFDIVLFDIAGIRFLDIEQVFIRNGLLIERFRFLIFACSFCTGACR